MFIITIIKVIGTGPYYSLWRNKEQVPTIPFCGTRNRFLLFTIEEQGTGFCYSLLRNKEQASADPHQGTKVAFIQYICSLFLQAWLGSSTKHMIVLDNINLTQVLIGVHNRYYHCIVLFP